MSHFNPSPSQPNRLWLRLIQAIGWGASAVLVIGLLLLDPISQTSTTVPMAQAASDRSATLHSQTAVTTYVSLPLIRSSTGALVVNLQSREDSQNFYLGQYVAWESDLYLGVYGWDAITGYMRDPGSGNYFVGHRRWVLYPQTQEMGTGDIPPVASHWPSNALWVFDSHLWESRPAVRDGFMAWPPRGYVPYQVVFARWSFAYPGADFSNATVTMASGGSNVSLAQSPVVNGYGENTLVWIPLGLSDGASWPRPASDTTYTVNIQNAKIGGQTSSFLYDVIVFDPMVN